MIFTGLSKWQQAMKFSVTACLIFLTYSATLRYRPLVPWVFGFVCVCGEGVPEEYRPWVIFYVLDHQGMDCDLSYTRMQKKGHKNPSVVWAPIGSEHAGVNGVCTPPYFPHPEQVGRTLALFSAPTVYYVTHLSQCKLAAKCYNHLHPRAKKKTKQTSEGILLLKLNVFQSLKAQSSHKWAYIF